MVVARCFLTLTLISGFMSQGAIAQAPANPAIDCYVSLSSRPPLAPLADKVVLSGQTKATLEMQANTSKPDGMEKAALAQWAAMLDACFDIGKAWMKEANVPRWFESNVMQTKDARDAILAALYRGELTYGEFNVKQEALSAELRKRMDASSENARREEASASTGSVTPAPAAKADPVQDRYQCSQDAVRSYPVVLVQRMTSPGFQAPPPLVRPSTQTNCTSFGGQISCATQPQTTFDTSIYNRPPTYVTEDSNLANRNAAFDACMVAKGYRRQ